MNKRVTTTIVIHFVFPFLFALLLCSGSALASEYYDDIVVSVESAPTNISYHGYAEYRISVTNNSADKAHQITLFAPFGSHGYGGDNIRRITRSVVLPPTSSANVSVLQPPLRINGRDLGVIIDGITQRKPVRLDTSSHCRNVYYRSGAGVPLCILLSRGVSIDDFENGAEEAVKGLTIDPAYGGPGSKMWHFIKSESSATAWSNNWLAYSRYDGIVLTASDMQTIPMSVNSALLQYVRCGGSLLILGKWKKPAEWRSEEDVLGPLRLSTLHFGACVVSRISDVADWKVGTWNKLRRDVWSPTASTLRKTTTVSDANKEFPVLEDLSMPVGGMFMLVLIYAITIGPVNLLILSRKKKRILMLWTVPIISIATCTAVFLYALLAEGWKGYLRTESITILDETTHSATTIGINGIYCPLTPRSGLHFDYETEVTPIGLREWQGGRSRTIDWTNDQHFAVGWIAARVPAHFLVRKNQMRRERVKITKTQDNEISALNGLGADIQQLWYADEDGGIYKAEDIAAGTKKALTFSDNVISADAGNDVWRKTYSSSWVRSPRNITISPQKYLRAHCYIAVIDDLVFLEQPLQNLEEKNNRSIVFGILKGSVDAS